MNKASVVSGVIIAFLQPGEGGQCGKKCGSGNCGFSVVRKECPCVVEETRCGEGVLLRIHCDSWQTTDREEARNKLTSFVNISAKRNGVAT